MFNSLISKTRALADAFQFENAISILLSRVFSRSNGLVIYQWKGTRILIDHQAGDQSGTKACLVSDMYRDFLNQIPKNKRPNILDIGGNGGGFVLLCQSIFRELGRVVSVEFNPDTFCRLWYNLKSNIGHDTIVLNAAAAGEDGVLNVANKQGSTSAKVVETQDKENSISIEKICLDTLISKFDSEKINIAKIDIEGSEFDLLLSEQSSLLSRIQYLIIEIHSVSGHETKEIEERLTSAGFKLLGKANPKHGDVRFYQKVSKK
ncbi:MAG: FkbM family methyltransferase [Chthoniobacterales bacterium]